jgi:serine/threonine protein kinase
VEPTQFLLAAGASKVLQVRIVMLCTTARVSWRAAADFADRGAPRATCDYHPKIADFGLAIAHEENRAMEETAVNKWLSPEAISERVYTFKSDVWSYGVTVWEVVTKQIPLACMRIVGDGLSPEIRFRPTAPSCTRRSCAPASSLTSTSARASSKCVRS